MSATLENNRGIPNYATCHTVVGPPYKPPIPRAACFVHLSSEGGSNASLSSISALLVAHEEVVLL